MLENKYGTKIMKKIIILAVVLFPINLLSKEINLPPSLEISINKFNKNKKQFSKLSDFMFQNNEIMKLALAPGSKFIDATDKNQKIVDIEQKTQEKLQKLLFNVEILWAMNVKNNLFLFIGEKDKYNNTFLISYIFFGNSNKNIITELTLCNSNINYERINNCISHIEKNWFLYYEWHPKQKKLMFPQKHPWPLDE